MSYLNIWKTDADVVSDGDLDDESTIVLDGVLSKDEEDRNKFNSFDYDEWLAGAAHLIKMVDALNEGEAIVITKDIN